MTLSMHRHSGWFAILAVSAISGCDSGSTPRDAGPTDTSRIADVMAADVMSSPDLSGDPRPAFDGGAGDPLPAPEDGPSFDAAPSSDGTSDSGVAAARSSLQRVLDPQVPAADVSTLAHDNAAFAFAAYKQLIADNTNLVFSPASISIALAMAYAGAAGTTASEMASTLHFSLPPGRLHAAFNALDQALASRGQGARGGDGGPMRLAIVNALWAQRDYAFKSEFLDTLAADYGAGVSLLDFIGAPNPSRLTINDWVAQQTNDKILDLLPPGSVDDLTRLVLTDAVYFNAAWNTPFSAAGTSSGLFTRLDGSSVSVKFMRQHNSLPALRGSNYVAASLPYADPRLSLLLVVPDAGQLSQVEASLDADALEALATGLVTQRVYLSLPPFKVETQASLSKLLSTLGMPSAFDDAVANFSGIADDPTLHITDVLHKAFINVGEKGTEAAASTGVVIRADASAGDAGAVPELQVIADRPFLYFLRDQPTGAIVFMGRIQDPAGP